jgi:hypothetical protein
VTKNGHDLQVISAELINIKAPVLAAVAQNWSALLDASAKPNNDKGVVLAAVAHDKAAV